MSDKLWCIKDPTGEFISLLDRGRNWVIDSFCGGGRDWKYLYRQGFRCVQIEINEAQPTKEE